MTDIDLIRKLIVEAAQLGFLIGTNNAKISDEDLAFIGIHIANITLDAHLPKF